jgi:hypothetical protein
MLSIIEVRWGFEELWDGTPFYPLFYRCNGDADIKTHAKGTILYPSLGRGRYYRDEVLAAIAWCEKFPEAVSYFKFEGAMEFLPYLKDPEDKGSYDQPFGFVRELFDKRARIVAENAIKIAEWASKGEQGSKPYNILEKVIKLILNSLYGKTAQSIGTVGEIPNCSNPFYAGAIPAGTRARLLKAALHNPHGVVFFATDGIMSIGPLEGLKTVEDKVLGEWEFAQELDKREAAVFVHPGIYSFHDAKGKTHTKTRGFRIDLDDARDLMTKEIVQAWRKGEPKLPQETTNFVTLGTAISSPENWKKCGSWRTQDRDINLKSCGAKRTTCHDKDRAKRLVFVPPAYNWEDDLSAPYYPDWLDEDEGGLGEMKDEQNAEFKFGGREDG